MAKVQLYVYDLSNGLAKTLSKQLTGRQIDGIWCVPLRGLRHVRCGEGEIDAG